MGSRLDDLITEFYTVAPNYVTVTPAGLHIFFVCCFFQFFFLINTGPFFKFVLSLIEYLNHVYGLPVN